MGAADNSSLERGNSRSGWGYKQRNTTHPIPNGITPLKRGIIGKISRAYITIVKVQYLCYFISKLNK